MSQTNPCIKSAAAISWRTRFMALGAALMTALMVACGGGSASLPENVPAQSGAALITLQDAAGDFLNYTVDVVSLKLRKASGAVVETLPATARVDFAQLVDLSEVISAGQIPAGDYVAATLTLNYSNASINADDGNGGSLVLAAQDANGNALTGPIELSVQLDNHQHLVITPGRTARLAFDFNLAASNSVDMSTATVKVSPLIQASVVPPAELAIRLRGGLVSTDTATSTYTVDVRPFHLGSGSAGQVIVHTASTTHFEIDGTSYTGSAGLAALANAAAGTITAAFGTLATSDLSYTARRVLVGSSVESHTFDRVRGDVIARSGNVLTVRGATLDRRDGGFEFIRGDVTVNVADTTRVTEEAQTGNFTITDISVGQRIWAAGTAIIDAATASATLDATAGRVRLEFTPMWGIVATPVSNPLTLSLRAIDGRNPAIYNFAGTGASAATDANPAAYAVDTGSLDLGALALDAPARVFGFPVPFGSAAGTDFNAQTVVSFSEVQTQLLVNWASGGSTTAFPGLNGGSMALDLDLSGVGLLHYMQLGPVRIDLLTLPAAPQIVADSTASFTAFAIGHAKSRRTESYHSFSDFMAALAADYNGATTALTMAANGKYDAVTNTLAANRLAVLLSD